jgi:hypothetical protein
MKPRMALVPPIIVPQSEEQQAELAHLFERVPPPLTEPQRFDALLAELREACAPNRWLRLRSSACPRTLKRREAHIVELYLKSMRMAGLCRMHLADLRDERDDS